MYDISYLNRLSQTLIQSSNGQERFNAEQTLTNIVESNDGLNCCILLLEKGEEPYAQAVAGSVLKRLLGRKVGITIQDRLQLSQYLLNYLVERIGMSHYVQNILCKHFALLTKIGWIERDQSENFPFQMPVNNIQALAKEPTQRGILALKLLSTLIEEINSDEGLESLARQRKISSDFRDTCLLDLFTLSLDLLQSVLDQSQNSLTDIYEQWISQVLDLALSCISFDFIGILNDETLDENVNIQIPTKWRPILLERQVISLFFNLYAVLPNHLVAKAFQSVVQLVSVRRMLFDSTDRLKYIDQIISGLKIVLDNPEKLGIPDNFHHFWRIISRMKANYQVSELIKSEKFSELLLLLTQFTLQSLEISHMFTNSSIYYLISFWSRMAGSLCYARVDTDMISNCIPNVSSSYIRSRMKICEAVVREGVEDPLDEMGSVKQTMELFTVIARKDYKRTTDELTECFDKNINLLFNSGVSREEILIAKRRLNWLIILMASGINGKSSTNNSDDDEDLYDGEIVSKIWKLMRMTDTRLELQQPNDIMIDHNLEFAFLYFMDEFRKAYISDQMQKDNRVYEKLSQSMGIADEISAIKFFAQKIITNLKFWGKNEKLLLSTLAFLNDLTVGYTNVRRLLKTDEIQFLLRSHTNFEFVSTNNDLTIMRSRTSFYASLMRLLNVELEEEPSSFEFFIKSIKEKCDAIKAVFLNIDRIQKTETEIQLRYAVIGLCRDLRGVALACTKKANFMMLLNWALPELFGILMESMKLWSNIADLSTPILKLLVELTMNRQSRLTYDMHSCTSVILFREISKLICDYGDRLLRLPEIENKNNYYKERLKNIGVISCLLRNVLSGSYLPFGVFWIYGDTCLTDALNTTFKLFLYLQQQNFLIYTKLAQVIYYFLDIVTRDSMSYISNLDEPYFIAILRAVHHGILGVDTSIISTSCTVLDQILDYIFSRLNLQTPVNSMYYYSAFKNTENNKVYEDFKVKEPEGNKWRTALEKEPDILYDLMSSILSQIIFEEIKCQWSMSRPLLGLIILNDKVGRYQECKIGLVRQQPAHLQMAIQQAFDKLMEGVKETVQSKNKDTFTQNLSVFKKDIELMLRGGVTSTNSTNDSSEEQEYGDGQFMTD